MELARAGPDGKPALLVREGMQEQADYVLLAEDQRYRIQRTGDSYALVVDTPGFSARSAQLVVQRLEHIARWRKIAELANPASRLPPTAVQLEILRPDDQGQWQPVEAGGDIRMDYVYRDGAWHQPQFKVKLINTSQRRLYGMLIDLPETYGVFPILPGGGVWLESRQEAWANYGEPFYGEMPEALWEQGDVSFKDTLKLIVCTDESDATLLEQEDLPVTVMSKEVRGKRSIARMNTLNRLMQRVGTRHIRTQPAVDEALVDWTTVDVSFTTVRPQEAVAIDGPEEAVFLGHGVTVVSHPHLKARARLTSLSQAGRDVGNLVLPAVLRDHPDIVEPFEFAAGRGGEPGLSVLELLDVNDYTVVTSEDPLMVRIDTPLDADAYLLPLGYDGEFFLPVGRTEHASTGVMVRIERLPAPTSGGTRDLKGSVKILFQKLVGQRLGGKYDYPQLAVTTVAADGTVDYNTDLSLVHAQVKRANRILLYINGILGDTRGMAASAQVDWLNLPQPVPALCQGSGSGGDRRRTEPHQGRPRYQSVDQLPMADRARLRPGQNASDT